MPRLRSATGGLVGLCALLVSTQPASADVVAALHHVQAIPLPGVAGRLDHLAIDVDHQRLFIAALGNGSLEVIDLAAGTKLRSLTGLKQPQGVSYLPSLRRVIVATGGGSVVAFDDGSFGTLGAIADLPDADNLRFDPTAGQLFVGVGAGARGGALAIVDPARLRHIADIPLPGHPEAFALSGSGASVFVNVPSKKSVVVIDRLRKAVTSTITLQAAAANYPMALDEAGNRLFVATRKPARVVVLDVRDGHVVTSFACVGDADDVFFDPGRQRIYISGGEGFVDAFDASEAGHNLRLAHVAVAPGARTSLWVPALRRLFVAAPRQGKQDAAIHVFEAPEGLPSGEPRTAGR
jgi:DNA-binding beta-propeller fold protein YncE